MVNADVSVPVSLLFFLNMKRLFKFSLFVCILLFLFVSNGVSQEPVGCGGYLRPSHSILYQQVSINLLSVDGSLRYTTDVNPNGAYSIPVYDYGDYIIKVDPPDGWSFEPVEGHRIAVKGRGSCAEDFNFQFSGFTLGGKVVTKGLKTGPSGIEIDLLDQKLKKPVSEAATTQQDGHFQFFKVMPGSYLVQVKGDKFKYDVKEAIVIVTSEGNANADGLLIVQGHSVHGSVTSDGQPIKRVYFFLYTKMKGLKLPNGCSQSVVRGYKSAEGDPLCHVESDSKGEFHLDTLPGGEYHIVPYYRGQGDLVFDVEPPSHSFVVEHAPVQLGAIFQVAGFAVSGRVVAAKNGDGVSGVQVHVEGKQKFTSVTGADGSFTLSSIRSGGYNLRVDAEAKGMRFEARKVDISPQKPRLEDLVAAKFAVCGKIILEHSVPSSSGSGTPAARQLSIETGDSARAKLLDTINSNLDGQFCAYLAPGHYFLRPLVTSEEDEAGLRLAPVRQEVFVISAPVYNLRFSQFRAHVVGLIHCLENCGSTFRVVLRPAGSAADTRVATITPHGSSASSKQWNFADVMPGKYQVLLEEMSWCWHTTELAVEVVDRDLLDGLVFEQTGYKLTVVSTHTANFTHVHMKPGKDKVLEQDNSKSKTVKLERGSQTMCLPAPGQYTLRASSCHKLEQTEWSYDTGHPSPVTVAALHHQVTVQLALDADVKDVYLQLEYEDPSAADGNRKIGPLLLDETHSAQVSLWEPVGTVVKLRPISSLALFSPSSSRISIAGQECNPTVAEIHGQRGVFVRGEVTPALAGVGVTLVAKRGEMKTGDLDLPLPDQPVLIHTDSKGLYQFGPLPRSGVYSVSAQKAGYKFTQQEYNFHAHKLAEVSAEVVDESGEPLSGVLLSVSGDEFRANELTEVDGRRVFLGLAPGTYYVRAAMKEYQFHPASASIKVQEGRAETVRITGKRVAYTASGVVTALNGDPETGVLLEAVAGESCKKHTEMALADNSGKFRLRGLQPGCQYTLRLRSGAAANQAIERTAPEKLLVDNMPLGDLPGLHFYAFRRVGLLQLSASVDAAEEHHSALKLQIFPESSPDNIIISHPLSKSAVLHTNSVPADFTGKKKYVLRLESTLSPSLWQNQGPQEKVFTASPGSSGAIHIRMQFNPTRRLADPELPVSSFFVLPLALLLLLAVYHRQTLAPYLDPLLSHLQDTLLRKLLGYGGGGSDMSGMSSGSLADPNDLSDISPDLLRPLTTGGGGAGGGATYRGGKSAKNKPRKT